MFPKSTIRVAVDAVVFAYREKTLRVLLIKTVEGERALPGGFVRNGEGLSVAVARELKEEAGITMGFLEQLYTYGDNVNRDSRAQVISVAYWSLVKPVAVASEQDSDANAATWFDIGELPVLAYDHKVIVSDAIMRLQAKLTYQPIGFELLPDVFGFSDLEKLYETILQRDIDRRNFRRKVLGFGILSETGKTRSEGAGRPATLYRFNEKRYQELVSEGYFFEIK
ncbi:MAG: NUDIX domain-containing protein [Saprospiraceae bacterium]